MKETRPTKLFNAIMILLLILAFLLLRSIPSNAQRYERKVIECKVYEIISRKGETKVYCYAISTDRKQVFIKYKGRNAKKVIPGMWLRIYSRYNRKYEDWQPGRIELVKIKL